MRRCNTCGTELDVLIHLMFFLSNTVQCTQCCAKLETTLPNPLLLSTMLGAVAGTVTMIIHPDFSIGHAVFFGFITALSITGTLAVLLPKKGAS